MRLQKPSPKSLMRSRSVDPKKMPPANTRTITASAKTKESGNHRSDQSARAIPRRANLPARYRGVAPALLRSSLGIVDPSFDRAVVNHGRHDREACLLNA